LQRLSAKKRPTIGISIMPIRLKRDAGFAIQICRRFYASRRLMKSAAWTNGTWAGHGVPMAACARRKRPGHDRPRCVYVDFLATGPAVSRTLRAQVQRRSAIRRVGDLCIVDLVVNDGVVAGAVGFSISDGRVVTIGACAVIIATGGLTRLYARNSASANMGGDGYALALRAGAELIDMEFVQFFPIGHLAPRLIGMDPIMWDPFRYKLGGQLLNAKGQEFIGNYHDAELGRYRAPRDIATYAILKEVEAGRGSPHGGVYLSFRHVPEQQLRDAFGPVIDRLAANGIDLTKAAIEVAPIAHYHMGGVRVAPSMETCVANLFAAGEAVGGANGANRLSGNAIPEAFVFGRIAGLAAADRARTPRRGWRDADAAGAIALLASASAPMRENPSGVLSRLQTMMSNYAGPIRKRDDLDMALRQLGLLKTALGIAPPPPQNGFDTTRLDWFDLRNMLLVAETVVRSALARTESRGAHQREDFPATDPNWAANQVVRLQSGRLALHAIASRDLPEGNVAE
jgi:succinate dehydrogenase/fumarate reductase flavoprotein subunit